VSLKDSIDIPDAGNVGPRIPLPKEDKKVHELPKRFGSKLR
jgi:hypothetical protein